MKFGEIPIKDALGAVLAHSLRLGPLRLKKGRRLTEQDLHALQQEGLDQITVAQLGPDDLSEDEAAERIGARLTETGEGADFRLSAPFAGRVNLFATGAGILRVDRDRIDAFNAVDPAITLATLPDYARVRDRQMVATCKIIPYGVPTESVARVEDVLADKSMQLHRFRSLRADVILTRTAGMKDSVLRKGGAAISSRLADLGLAASAPVISEHDAHAVARAVKAAQGDMVLILGGSATSDISDTCPSGVVAAGGSITRFGMPVDPGNLLFLGVHDARPVVGLPGCARSPALNGADWVLERLAAGIEVTSADIAAMGVGGLLKEIPLRPQPRSINAPQATGAPRVSVILLAAGQSRRMRGADKLLETVEAQPMLRYAAQAAKNSAADEVIVVLPPDAASRREAIDDLDVRIVVAQNHQEGMAASLAAGVSAVSEHSEAAIVALADMPEVGAKAYDALIAAFDAAEGREICRAVTQDGAPGHPVLFGRRFFENLAGLRGDRGARELVAEADEFVVDVPTPGASATVDLDTPEDWKNWRERARR